MQGDKIILSSANYTIYTERGVKYTRNDVTKWKKKLEWKGLKEGRVDSRSI